MKYYVYEKGQQAGPFSIDELKKRSLNIHTPVWNEGMMDWADAGTVDELAVLFKVARSRNEAETDADLPATLLGTKRKPDFNNGRLAGWSALGVLVIILCGTFFFSKAQPGTLQANANAIEDSRAACLKREQQNPAQFITGKFKNANSVKGKKEFVLDLHNNAILANYRDIVLSITYLSKTGTELGSERLTITETLKAGQSISTAIKATAPAATHNVKISIEEAIAAD